MDANRRMDLDQCFDGEDNPVRIIAHKFDGYPPSYAFRVINGSDYPISDFQIGSGYERFMSYEALLPEIVSFPPDWYGIGHLCIVGTYPEDFRSEDNVYLCPYMSYIFASQGGRENDIQPGESLAGFAIQLHTEIPISRFGYTEQEVTRIDNTWDLRHMPFLARVIDSDVCFVGMIEDSGGRRTDAR